MATLQETCLLITDGKHGDCQNEEASGFYFISCKDVKDGWIDYSGARQITEKDYLDTDKRTQLEPNDILITNSGTIGRMVLVNDVPETSRTTFQKSVAIIKPNLQKVFPQWLFYSLLANRPTLISWAGGTAQKNLLLRDLRAFDINISPFPTQEKIAAILSAYDDLIENNLRRIKILEEMAQNLYREWFVKFRFPGHQKVKMVNSPLGKIPEGWEVAEFDKMADLSRQSVNPQEKPEKIFVHFSIPSFDTGQLPTLEKGAEIKSLKFYVPEECVLLSKLNPRIRRVWLPDPPDGYTATTSTEFLVLVPKAPFGREFLYSVCMTPKFTDTLAGFAGGTSTSHQRVKPEDVLRLKLPIPDAKILGPFDKIVSPMVSLSSSLRRRNQNLRQTRDLLLPKLISGELDVSELDITIPEANA